MKFLGNLYGLTLGALTVTSSLMGFAEASPINIDARSINAEYLGTYVPENITQYSKYLFSELQRELELYTTEDIKNRRYVIAHNQGIDDTLIRDIDLFINPVKESTDGNLRFFQIEDDDNLIKIIDPTLYQGKTIEEIQSAMYDILEFIEYVLVEDTVRGLIDCMYAIRNGSGEFTYKILNTPRCVSEPVLESEKRLSKNLKVLVEYVALYSLHTTGETKKVSTMEEWVDAAKDYFPNEHMYTLLSHIETWPFEPSLHDFVSHPLFKPTAKESDLKKEVPMNLASCSPLGSMFMAQNSEYDINSDLYAAPRLLGLVEFEGVTRRPFFNTSVITETFDKTSDYCQSMKFYIDTGKPGFSEVLLKPIGVVEAPTKNVVFLENPTKNVGLKRLTFAEADNIFGSYFLKSLINVLLDLAKIGYYVDGNEVDAFYITSLQELKIVISPDNIIEEGPQKIEYFKKGLISLMLSQKKLFNNCVVQESLANEIYDNADHSTVDTYTVGTTKFFEDSDLKVFKYIVKTPLNGPREVDDFINGFSKLYINTLFVDLSGLYGLREESLTCKKIAPEDGISVQKARVTSIKKIFELYSMVIESFSSGLHEITMTYGTDFNSRRYDALAIKIKDNVMYEITFDNHFCNLIPYFGQILPLLEQRHGWPCYLQLDPNNEMPELLQDTYRKVVHNTNFVGRVRDLTAKHYSLDIIGEYPMADRFEMLKELGHLLHSLSGKLSLIRPLSRCFVVEEAYGRPVNIVAVANSNCFIPSDKLKRKEEMNLDYKVVNEFLWIHRVLLNEDEEPHITPNLKAMNDRSLVSLTQIRQLIRREYEERHLVFSDGLLFPQLYNEDPGAFFKPQMDYAEEFEVLESKESISPYYDVSPALLLRYPSYYSIQRQLPLSIFNVPSSNMKYKELVGLMKDLTESEVPNYYIFDQLAEDFDGTNLVITDMTPGSFTISAIVAREHLDFNIAQNFIDVMRVALHMAQRGYNINLSTPSSVSIMDMEGSFFIYPTYFSRQKDPQLRHDKLVRELINYYLLMRGLVNPPHMLLDEILDSTDVDLDQGVVAAHIVELLVDDSSDIAVIKAILSQQVGDYDLMEEEITKAVEAADMRAVYISDIPKTFLTVNSLADKISEGYIFAPCDDISYCIDLLHIMRSAAEELNVLKMEAISYAVHPNLTGYGYLIHVDNPDLDMDIDEYVGTIMRFNNLGLSTLDLALDGPTTGVPTLLFIANRPMKPEVFEPFKYLYEEYMDVYAQIMGPTITSAIRKQMTGLIYSNDGKELEIRPKAAYFLLPLLYIRCFDGATFYKLLHKEGTYDRGIIKNILTSIVPLGEPDFVHVTEKVQNLVNLLAESPDN